MPGPFSVVITAGGRVEAGYAAAAGTDIKALAPVRGETMLARIVSATRKAGASRIAVVGGDDVRRACADSVDRVIDEMPTGGGNVLAALAAWPQSEEPLLYATSDMPYANAAAVADFLSRAPSASLAIALCNYDAFARRFPKAPPGFGITLAGERVVNGGLFLIPPGATRQLANAAAAFFDARKSPWRMVRLVNVGAAFRYAIGRLSIAHLEAEATRILGIPATAVRDCAPELGYDADTLEEYVHAVEFA